GADVQPLVGAVVGRRLLEPGPGGQADADQRRQRGQLGQVGGGPPGAHAEGEHREDDQGRDQDQRPRPAEGGGGVEVETGGRRREQGRAQRGVSRRFSAAPTATKASTIAASRTAKPWPASWLLGAVARRETAPRSSPAPPSSSGMPATAARWLRRRAIAK